jgi:hypothetical protein
MLAAPLCMDARGAVDSETQYRELERGTLAFAMRPRVELPGVQRFFLLLSPEGGSLHRRITVGKKHLPRTGMRDREWAYVELTTETPSELMAGLGTKTYETKSKGVRHQAAARVVAEANYRIVTHRDHTHLEYVLEEAYENGHDGRLLDSLAIQPRGSLIVVVFNPLAKRSWRSRRDGRVPDDREDADMPFREPSIFPDELQERFGDRRFGSLEPAFLDYEGAELVLIPGGDT